MHLPLLSPATQQPLNSRVLLENVTLARALNEILKAWSTWEASRQEKCNQAERVRGLENEVRHLQKHALEQDKIIARARNNLMCKDRRLCCSDAEFERLQVAVDSSAKSNSPSTRLEETSMLQAELRNREKELRDVTDELGRLQTSVDAERQHVQAVANRRDAALQDAHEELLQMRSNIQNYRMELEVAQAYMLRKEGDLHKAELDLTLLLEQQQRQGAELMDLDQALFEMVSELHAHHDSALPQWLWDDPSQHLVTVATAGTSQIYLDQLQGVLKRRDACLRQAIITEEGCLHHAFREIDHLRLELGARGQSSFDANHAEASSELGWQEDEDDFGAFTTRLDESSNSVRHHRQPICQENRQSLTNSSA